MFAASIHRWQHGLLLCLSVGVFVLVSGCSSSANVPNIVAKLNDSNIKRAANLFGTAIERNGWRAPKDEAAFREFIKNGMAAHKLKWMGVDPENLDPVFISERDGKPFKFRYGQELWLYAVVPVVFEQQGVNGVRQVATNTGAVEDVTNDAHYQELWNGKPSATPQPGPPPGENAGSDTSKQSAAK